MNYYNFIFTVASGKVKSQVIWNHSLSRLYVLLIYYELKVTPLLPVGSIAQSMTPWLYPTWLAIFWDVFLSVRETPVGEVNGETMGEGAKRRKKTTPPPPPSFSF